MTPSQRLRSLFVLALLCPTPQAVTAGDEFRVVLLPDTQLYSESHPEIYAAQTQWIKDRAERDHIKFVIHLGDIVQNPGAEEEWKNADRAHRILDGVVPYSMLPGNHDMRHADGRPVHDTPLYDKYFPVTRFDKYSWYGGHQGRTNGSNNCFFEADEMKFMVLSLEFAPTDAALQWAGRVVNEHPGHRVIVATHCYMRLEGRDCNCGGQIGNGGQGIWDKLIRKHKNIFLVVSGHVLGKTHQTSTNDAGAPVHEILCDYQGYPNGGNGWLQTLRFVPEENQIHVEAYSPHLKRHNRDPQHTYALPYATRPVTARTTPPTR
jgi:hypothetical protein